MSQATVVSGGPANPAYDQVPYESYPFPQSHPDRLATMGRMFGVNAAPIDKCRVLELGCASGGNLVPVAYAFPNSEFVGVDLSQAQVAVGQKMIDGTGLKNVQLKHMSISDIDESLGQFDYIICHGVYSWVPNEVQESILRVIEKNLKDDGIAYVSYNIYPGWHFRGMIRDMMLYHVSQFSDPPTKAAQARALLDFLSQSVPKDGNAFGSMLKDEVELLKNQKDYYLLHDHLEELNEPVYFHEFTRRAASHGLQFLSEIDLGTMLTSQFSQNVMETLNRISNEIVRTEQYMDFIRNRTFRQTLLCKSNIQLNRNLSGRNIMQFYICCNARPSSENMDAKSFNAESFALPNGITLTTQNPLVKAALHHLGQIFPQSISFEDLYTVASSRLASVSIKDAATVEREKDTLAADLLTLYSRNLLILRSCRLPFTVEISDRPHVSDIGRYLAKNGFILTNITHDAVTTDVLGQHIMELCDGTLTQEEVLTSLVERAKSGALNVHKEGRLLKDDAEIRAVLDPIFRQTLQNIAKSAMMVS